MKIFPLVICLFIYTFLIFQVQNSTLDQIPKAYISDSSFIAMTLETQAPAGKLYAAPKGHGDSCTITSPCTIQTAADKLKPGYYLYLKEGTYNAKDGIYFTKSGEKNKYIVITSVPGENKPIISSECNKGSVKCSEITLFAIEKASYIIIENIHFKNAVGQDLQGIGLFDGGQNHIIIRNCVFDNLKTTNNKSEDYNASGITLLGEKAMIKNVMIYKNTLSNNRLGYSEAISIMGNCENIYVLNNTLKSNTNIGIDFNGNNGDGKTSSLDQPRNSVAMYNIVENSKSSYADCAGIYADGAKNILIYGNRVTKSDCGIEVGAEGKKNNNPVTNIIVENNKLINNTVAAIKVGGFDKTRYFVKNTLFKNNVMTNGQNSIIITKSDNITFIGNKISGASQFFVEMEDDLSSSDIKNIKFEKNTFSGKAKFYIYGKDLTLKQFVEKYNTNTIK